MPLYEYQCEVCATRFERIQKFSDPPVETCPSCEGAVRKLVSSPAIQFKGSGWYITDYAKKGAARDREKGDTAKDSKDSASTSESSSAASSGDSASSASSRSDSAGSAAKTAAAGSSSGS